MCRVLYDEGGFLMSHGGVSRYFAEMIRRLPDSVEWKLAMKSTCNVYLREEPFNLPPHQQTVHDFIRQTLHGRSFCGVSYVYKWLARLMPHRFPSGELANERAFARELRNGEFDVLHLTHPHPVKNIWRQVVGRKQIVVTVHDLIPELIYRDRIIFNYRKQLLHDASHIIAVSENTKNDIVWLYGTPEDKISVIYHGCLSTKALEVKPYTSDVPYLLYVGKRGGYKRFAFLMKAIAPILKTGRLTLFCTGTEFNAEELTMIKELGVSGVVKQRFVSDNEMMSLFAGAIAFVYPSIYEGFGIPILDAFSVNCPVILSRSSCFPEIAGDAALYFDPDDEKTLRSHIEDLQNNESLRKQMIVRGAKRLSGFSWEKCAKETGNVYRQLCNES